jgi:hypothetical protein
LNENVECLYCKYAFSCSDEFKKAHNVPFFKSLSKIEEITGVKVVSWDSDNLNRDILNGSWIQEYPELLEKFKNMSFEKQMEMLRNPDILKYKDIFQEQGGDK